MPVFPCSMSHFVTQILDRQNKEFRQRYEDTQLLRDLSSQPCFSWFERFNGPFDGLHNGLRSSPTVQKLAKDLMIAAIWLEESETLWRNTTDVRGAGFRPGQYSDGSSLKRGYSFSVASGVFDSYLRAGRLPCGLPAARVPILIEVCYSVMLLQGHSMLTDRCAFIHVALFLPTLFTVRMLPLQWSSALFWMVASTKPRGVGHQTALPLCNFLRSLVLPGSQVRKSSLWSNSSVLRLWVAAFCNRAVLYVDTKLSTDTLPLFRPCRWSQHVGMHLPDYCASWHDVTASCRIRDADLCLYKRGNSLPCSQKPSLIAILHRADLVHALPSSLRYSLF